MRYIVLVLVTSLFCCCANNPPLLDEVASEHRFQITDTFSKTIKHIDNVPKKDQIVSNQTKLKQDKKSFSNNDQQKAPQITLSQKTNTFEQQFHQGFIGLMKFFGYAAIVIIVLLLFWWLYYLFIYNYIRNITHQKNTTRIPKTKQSKDIVIRISQEQLDTITKSMPYGGKVQVGITIDSNPPPRTV